MNRLDSQHLFYSCPYPVKVDEEEFTFKTDHDIVYAVSFKEESFFNPIPAYWFDLMNRSIEFNYWVTQNHLLQHLYQPSFDIPITKIV